MRAVLFTLALAALAVAFLSPVAPKAQTLGAAASAPSGVFAPVSQAREPAVVVAAETLRPGTLLTARHLELIAAAPRGAEISDPQEVIGMETLRAIYRGRAIRRGDLGPPMLIRRNELVLLSFRLGGLSLTTEGRALDDAALGERVRVMNMDSRRTVSGVVAGPGRVETSERGLTQ